MRREQKKLHQQQGNRMLLSGGLKSGSRRSVSPIDLSFEAHVWTHLSILPGVGNVVGTTIPAACIWKTVSGKDLRFHVIYMEYIDEASKHVKNKGSTFGSKCEKGCKEEECEQVPRIPDGSNQWDASHLPVVRKIRREDYESCIESCQVAER